MKKKIIIKKTITKKQPKKTNKARELNKNLDETVKYLLDTYQDTFTELAKYEQSSNYFQTKRITDGRTSSGKIIKNISKFLYPVVNLLSLMALTYVIVSLWN